MKKRLSALTCNINILDGTKGDPLIKGIAYDSRLVEEGFLFIALTGIHTDGHAFIPDAIRAGAAAILYSTPETSVSEDCVFLRTENTRTAMSPIAAAFYDYPAEKMIIVGVTGTDGKTSTVYFIDQLLELCGRKSGFISTAACKTGTMVDKNPYRQSTPEAVEINMLLSEMLKNGKTHAVIESTSHGLSPKNNRLGDIRFDAGVFTNLSHEHLEFHGSIEQYRDDKANLFRQLKDGKSFGIVNNDDENAGYFIEAATERVYTCSLKDGNADFYAGNIRMSAEGAEFTVTINEEDDSVVTVDCMINLPGLFNIENVLEAAATVYRMTGDDFEKIAGFLPELSAVKGRMKLLQHGQPFTALIDYAHTPGSFLKLFPDLRKQTDGRLIAVFGSAGERDTAKRPEQGKIAAGYADILILTDEDPRGENSKTILEEIESGALTAERRNGLAPLRRDENIFLVSDRTEAFRKAFTLAQPGDTVVMLGKGHEGSIIFSDGPRPWDEEAAASALLKEMFG